MILVIHSHEIVALGERDGYNDYCNGFNSDYGYDEEKGYWRVLPSGEYEFLTEDQSKQYAEQYCKGWRRAAEANPSTNGEK